MDDERQSLALVFLVIAKLAVLAWYAVLGGVVGFAMWYLLGGDGGEHWFIVASGLLFSAYRISNEWDQYPALILRLTPASFLRHRQQQRQDSDH